MSKCRQASKKYEGPNSNQQAVRVQFDHTPRPAITHAAKEIGTASAEFTPGRKRLERRMAEQPEHNTSRIGNFLHPLFGALQRDSTANTA